MGYRSRLHSEKACRIAGAVADTVERAICRAVSAPWARVLSSSRPSPKQQNRLRVLKHDLRPRGPAVLQRNRLCARRARGARYVRWSRTRPTPRVFCGAPERALACRGGRCPEMRALDTGPATSRDCHLVELGKRRPSLAVGGYRRRSRFLLTDVPRIHDQGQNPLASRSSRTGPDPTPSRGTRATGWASASQPAGTHVQRPARVVAQRRSHSRPLLGRRKSRHGLEASRAGRRSAADRLRYLPFILLTGSAAGFADPPA